MRKSEKERVEAKITAIVDRLTEIHGNRQILISMLPEYKLDMLIAALGLGEIRLGQDGATATALRDLLTLFEGIDAGDHDDEPELVAARTALKNEGA